MARRRTIQQAANETGLSPDVLRYYERIGLIGQIERTAAGHRAYDDEDIFWIQFLKQLRATGMPIAQMQTFAELRRRGEATSRERRKMLEAHREALERQVTAIHDFIELIDKKIARHREVERRLGKGARNG